MRIEPITCNIGAELLDVSLRDAAYDDGLFNEVYAALLKHRVLFLRDQDISGKDHVAFAARMGELEDHPILPTPDDTPGLVRIYKTPEQSGSYENVWHHDDTWRGVASKACVLHCVECPPVGGDTMWANMVLAYEKLPDAVKAQIEGLRAAHSFLEMVRSAMTRKSRHKSRLNGRMSSTTWCRSTRKPARRFWRWAAGLHTCPTSTRAAGCAADRMSGRPAATCSST